MFFEIINLIKVGYKHNLLFQKIILKKNDLKIIKILIELGILKKIIKIKKNEFFLYYNYINNLNQKSFYNIKNMYKPSHKKFIKLKELKKLTFTKKFILILSTNKGLMTNFNAIKYKKGGLLVAKI